MADDAPLTIDVSADGDTTTVRLTGELDVHTAPALGEALTSALDGTATKIEIDATDLRFCDSSGIQVLVQAREKAMTDGGTVQLTGVHGSVEKVLSVTGLLELFT
jgi:anti-sigma B factor antagonist